MYDPYNQMVFTVASRPLNSGAANPLRPAKRADYTTTTRARARTLKVAAGSSVPVNMGHVIPPSRSKMAATRLIHKYIHKIPCVKAAPPLCQIHWGATSQIGKHANQTNGYSGPSRAVIASNSPNDRRSRAP